MRIALIGYGKMGKAIERIAVARGHAIVAKIDIGDKTSLQAADVAIEFSQPAAAPGNIFRAIDAGIPVVCGTTGWLERKQEVENYCKEKNGTFFYASNFSLGVNLFFHLNEMLAKIMDKHRDYNISINETHHSEKKDAPSGTAITLAEGILKNNHAKKKWTLPPAREDELLITPFRIDPAPGTHVVRYTSAIDDIELTHTAHSREGFATGAVLVAEWLVGKKGIFSMADFLKF